MAVWVTARVTEHGLGALLVVWPCHPLSGASVVPSDTQLTGNAPSLSSGECEEADGSWHWRPPAKDGVGGQLSHETVEIPDCITAAPQRENRAAKAK